MAKKYLGVAPSLDAHLSTKEYVDDNVPLVLNAEETLPEGTPDGTVVVRISTIGSAVSSTITLSTGWTALAGKASPIAYKDTSGFVVIQGIVQRTGATITNDVSGTIATLPSGYRPNGDQYYVMAKDGAGFIIEVKTTGVIQALSTSTWTQNVSYIGFTGTFMAA